LKQNKCLDILLLFVNLNKKNKIKHILMKKIHRRQFLQSLGLASASLLFTGCARSRTSKNPNIVFIMADDMGYGDPGCYNPDSKTSTPHIDRLAQQGIRFTNAHSPGTLCVPARYGLLTGRYPFRTDIAKHQVTSLIEPGRMTIGSLLQKNGYYTACIGKWHLGFDNINTIDYSKPMTGGPVDHGFDEFFGMHASLDIPPYYFIKNNFPVQPPTNDIGASHSEGVTPIQGEFWRAGKIAPGFKHDEVLSVFKEKALDFLNKQKKDRAFFMYLALAAPHTPWLPTGKFRGTSKAGEYGDFVVQVDDAIGQVLAKLEKLGFTKNTIVIFTSDNGPVWYEQDIKQYNHRSTGFLKGMKADAWEGGHRMPFIARWPGHIKPGSESDEVICFTDMLATFAEIVGDTLPEYAGEDSYSILPVLLQQNYNKPLRQATVIEDRAIIQGEWKLILGSGLGGLHARYSSELQSKKKEGDKTGELYNIKADPSEIHNLYEQHPEIVSRLYQLLETYREKGRSVIRN